MKCTQRLYLTADRKRVVPAGDKKAASLYAVPGDEIPQSAADRFGLVDGHLRGFEPHAGEKEDRGGKDKEDRGGKDKGGQGGGDKTPELTDVKGIGEATAKLLTGAGIVKVADLAAVDPANPPAIEGLNALFKWSKAIGAAKELVAKSGESA